MNTSLLGRRIVNTRATHQAAELDRLLEHRGAVALSFPCIAIEPPVDTGPLDQALRDLVDGRFRWLVLTSSNTVQAVADRLEALKLGRAIPVDVSIAVVGPSTARAVEAEFGRTPEIIPGHHDGAALASVTPVAPGDAVLAPGSDIARPELARDLAEKGALVTAVVAYRTVMGSGGVDLPAMLREGQVDAVTFASSSAVEGFFTRLAMANLEPLSLIDVPIVCIGETTYETVRHFGLAAHSSSTQTLEGLLETMERLFAPVGTGGTVWP